MAVLTVLVKAGAVVDGATTLVEEGVDNPVLRDALVVDVAWLAASERPKASVERVDAVQPPTTTEHASSTRSGLGSVAAGALRTPSDPSGAGPAPIVAAVRHRQAGCHRRGARGLVAGIAGALVLGACGSPSETVHKLSSASARGTTTVPVAVTTPTTTPTTTLTTTAPATTEPAPTSTAPSATVAPTNTQAVADIAGQEVVVDAPGYGATTATLSAYQRTTAGWRLALGPWRAFVGYEGVAPPGAKREGDGRTPSGTFGFGFGFGIDPNPGLRLSYRPVTGPDIVWDDDPSSPLYNQWVDTSRGDPGADPEPMDNAPAYDYGAVIDYNTAPIVPGAGSAIFLHVSTGGATAGCVALPVGELLAVLRWLDPAQSPTVTIGVGAAGP